MLLITQYPCLWPTLLCVFSYFNHLLKLCMIPVGHGCHHPQVLLKFSNFHFGLGIFDPQGITKKISLLGTKFIIQTSVALLLIKGLTGLNCDSVSMQGSKVNFFQQSLTCDLWPNRSNERLTKMHIYLEIAHLNEKRDRPQWRDLSKQPPFWTPNHFECSLRWTLYESSDIHSNTQTNKQTHKQTDATKRIISPASRSIKICWLSKQLLLTAKEGM